MNNKSYKKNIKKDKTKINYIEQREIQQISEKDRLKKIQYFDKTRVLKIKMHLK